MLIMEPPSSSTVNSKQTLISSSYLLANLQPMHWYWRLVHWCTIYYAGSDKYGLIKPGSTRRHKAKRRRIKTVMQELMYLAARVSKTSRYIKLAFGRDCKVFHVMDSLYQRLAYGLRKQPDTFQLRCIDSQGIGTHKIRNQQLKCAETNKRGFIDCISSIKYKRTF